MRLPLVFRFISCYQANREAQLQPSEHHPETLTRRYEVCDTMKQNENRKHHSVVLVKQGTKFCVYVGHIYADHSDWWFYCGGNSA